MMDGNVPDLGAVARKPPEHPKAAVQPVAFMRRLEEDGTYEPELVRLPNGQMAAVPHRTDFVDAEQLVEMIVVEVRKELRAFAVRIGKPEAAGE